MKAKGHICPVCGFDNLQEEVDAGSGPSYEICPCCGFEFGFDDGAREENYDSYRQEWLKQGAKWFNPRLRPENWDPHQQLKNIN